MRPAGAQHLRALGSKAGYRHTSRPPISAGPLEFESAFKQMKGLVARAAFIQFGGLLADAARIAKLAVDYGVPTMFYTRGFVDGGLMSFSMYHENRFQREAAIIDKLLRGVKPAAIPWELPDTAHLALNLGTARSLGLHFPEDLLLRANQIVK